MPIGPKDPAETVVVSIDFNQELAGETIASINSVAASVINGTDPTPSLILSGVPFLNGNGIVGQGVTAGVIGVVYELKANITTSGNRVLVGAAEMPMVVE